MASKYIAFEGCDESGRSTLSKAFARRNGFVWTCEPDIGTELTMILHDLALNEKWTSMTDIAREYILLANRSISLSFTNEMLGCGNTVVSDKSFVSGLVHAKVFSNMMFDRWRTLSKEVITVFPDLIVMAIGKNQETESNPEIVRQFPEALNYVKYFDKQIPIVQFENDLLQSGDENLSRLESLLKSSRVW
jgi:hypothetical protein